MPKIKFDTKSTLNKGSQKDKCVLFIHVLGGVWVSDKRKCGSESSPAPLLSVPGGPSLIRFRYGFAMEWFMRFQFLGLDGSSVLQSSLNRNVLFRFRCRFLENSFSIKKHFYDQLSAKWMCSILGAAIATQL